MIQKHSSALRSLHPSVRLFSLFLALVAVLVGSFAIVSHLPQFKTHADFALNKKVIGYYVYWDQARGLATIENNNTVFNEISPWAYTLQTDGSVILDPNGGANVVDSTSLNYFRSQNMKLIPAIHNLVNGTWNNGNIVSNIINSPTAAQNHINNIVTMVTTNNYDGVDIDYENLNGSTDRQAYSNFITNLASALHAQGKMLTVDVYGKTSEPGSWSGPQAQDYAALGQAADEVRIFLYDYNPGTVGPIAPYSWIQSVLSFAPTEIAPAKIIQGIGLYGYDWPAASGKASPTTDTWTDVMNTAQQYNATVQWDTTNLAPWFTYKVSNKTHTVWFENNQSTGDKLDLANQYGVGGVDFWRLGGEDPATWTVLQTKFATPSPSATATPVASGSPAPSDSSSPTPTPTADTTPPTVQITSPANGAKVGFTVPVTATASDNVAVAKVDFYVDGVFTATSPTAPYGFTWNTRGLTNSNHTIMALAYDTSGNVSAPSQVTVHK